MPPPTKVKWVRVESSNLKQIAFAPGEGKEPGTLWVRFVRKPGSDPDRPDTYRYDGVPAKVATALLAAESKGAYFAEHVRDDYPFTAEG